MEKSFFAALLQIVTDALPISSGGHVFLLKKLLFEGSEFLLFEIIEPLSHGPTLLCILLIFWPYWGHLAIRLLSPRNFRRILPVFLRITTFVIAADIITALFYFVVRIHLKDASFLQSPWLLLLGVVVTTMGLLSLLFLEKEGAVYKQLDLYKVLLIGVVQGVALLPGISRFATTYVAARWLQISPRRALQFSFLIYVPLIVLAFGNAARKIVMLPSDQYQELISLFCSVQSTFFVILATVISYFALRLACRWGMQGKLWRFGIYMIFPSLLVGLLLLY